MDLRSIKLIKELSTHPLVNYAHRIASIFLQELKTTVQKAVPANQGLKTAVFFVTTSIGEFVIRFPKKHLYRIPAQAWALQEWTRLGIPAPHLITYGKDYLIEDKIDGQPMSQSRLTREQQQKIMHEAGHILYKIHTVKTKGYGYLKKPGQGSNKTWKSFIEPKFRQHLHLLEKDQLLSKDLLNLIRKYYISHKEFLNYNDPRILHADLTGSNILIKNGKLKAIIDPSDVASGDPHYGLGLKNAYYFDNKILKPFFQGYGNVDLQKVQFYSLLHLVRLVYFFHAQVPRQELVHLFIERIQHSMKGNPSLFYMPKTDRSWAFLQQLSSVSNL